MIQEVVSRKMVSYRYHDEWDGGRNRGDAECHAKDFEAH